ncbi:MAG: hypothetical protein ACPGGN_05105 [Opitutales bacterium]
MTSPPQTVSTLLTYLPLVLLSLATQAYEQSSYHVFELIESGSEETLDGRIAIPKAIFAKDSEPTADSITSAIEQSEFEIDFTRPLWNRGRSDFISGLPDFETNQKIDTTDPSGESFHFGNSSFGTSTSSFED